MTSRAGAPSLFRSTAAKVLASLFGTVASGVILFAVKNHYSESRELEALAATRPRLQFQLRLAGSPPLGIVLKNGGQERAIVRSMGFAKPDGDVPASRRSWMEWSAEAGIPDSAIEYSWLDGGDAVLPDHEQQIVKVPPELLANEAFKPRFERALESLEIRLCYCSTKDACESVSFPPNKKDDGQPCQ